MTSPKTQALSQAHSEATANLQLPQSHMLCVTSRRSGPAQAHSKPLPCANIDIGSVACIFTNIAPHTLHLRVPTILVCLNGETEHAYQPNMSNLGMHLLCLVSAFEPVQ